MGTVICRSSIMSKVVFLCLLGAVYGGVPTCNTVWEEKCWDEPRQECKAVQKPFTTTQYEQECTSIQVPKVDRVPEQKCTDVPEQKCHTAQEKVCNTVSETKVDYVTKPKCGLETEEQ